MRSVIIIWGVAMVMAIASICFFDWGTSPARAAAAFDHSVCQYPNRATNPPDGCDNTDPCDGAQAKVGSGDCVDQTAPAPVVTPVVTPTVTATVPRCVAQ